MGSTILNLHSPVFLASCPSSDVRDCGIIQCGSALLCDETKLITATAWPFASHIVIPCLAHVDRCLSRFYM